MAAAGLLIGGVTLAPKAARAADLGGDCCADLEERVANLEATTARKGNKKVSLTIKGRVSATMTYWMESPTLLDAAYPFDHHSDLYFGDSSGSGANIKFTGEAKVSSDLTAGYYLEIGDGAIKGGQHGATGAKGNTQVSHQAAGTIDAANTYVYLTSKSLGTLQLGKIDNSGDSYDVNFNGAVMGDLTAGRAGTSFIIRDVAGQLTDKTYGSALDTLEPGGENGIRYNSANFGGFSVTGSMHGDDAYGLGANYAGTFKTISVGFGVGYGSFSRVDGKPDYNELGLSAGIKDSASGLFLQGAYARKSVTGLSWTPTNTFVEGGWAKNVWGVGDTTVYVGYDKSVGVGGNLIEAHSLQVGVDQTIDSAASHVYLTYEQTSLDSNQIGGAFVLGSTTKAAGLTDSQSVSTITGGMTINF